MLDVFYSSVLTNTFLVFYAGTNPAFNPSDGALLLEDGSFLLLEDGSLILLE